LGPSRTNKAITAAFNTICRLGNAQTVNQLIQEGHMRINAGSVRSLSINIAIRSRHLHIIDAILDASADITILVCGNISKRKDLPQCMLEIAKDKGAEVIEHLIKRGAIVPSEISKWDCGDQWVYDVMRIARITQGGVDVPTYEEVMKFSKEFMKL
jgi:hypothetical protein